MNSKDRNHGLPTNMKDDIARVPTLEPELGNLSKYWQEHSWETRDELFQLGDAIGSNDIIGLRPIYRKDLPKEYIAYWEVKMNGKTGEKYLIISAAKETGDHRLVQEGALPSPIDIMTDYARLRSHSCHRVYRLTPDGLMTCEDNNLKRTVAATRDVETNAEFQQRQWKKLDRQVKKALPRFKKAWRDLARRVTKLPEWRRFKWLSMKSGKMPTEKSSKHDSSSRHEHDDDYDDNYVTEEDDEMEAELAVRPGEVLKVPLIGKSCQVRIKFSGFGQIKRHGRKRKTWLNRWQKRLCRVLSDPCEGSDMTRVKWRYIKNTKMGDRYIGLQIVSSSQYVRKQLQGQEIRFRIEVEMNNRKTLVVNYGIMLRHSRRGRSVEGGDVNHYSIPHRHLFPDYKQHQHGLCMTGSGAVAWGMVLGYMDNLAYRVPESGYPKNILGLFPGTSPAPMTTTKYAQSAIENLFEKLESRCSLEDKAALTSPAKMERIGKWLNHTVLQLIIENDSLNKETATARAVQLLQKRVPVIISKERGDSLYHHYSVATRLRQRIHRYRNCKVTCSSWRTLVENEAYVHLGVGKYGNKWENIDTHFMAAILKK
ncbi:uncharacterized protein LOC116306677 isoform X2 [Actinia tenebrosa]|uniref:Uncharacterized protein LOC116306677 isoform X2 n=1 Tax=Actinia tenebrosa TaxID=6105 RepID=A0A6P8J3M9_ACTTE|nr:uncharacterized protein LOC116306677 isoform X2 [Actinia tenebrosa]